MWIRFVRISTRLPFLAAAAALIRVSLRVRRGRSYLEQSDGDARGDGAFQSTVLGRSRFPSSTPILRASSSSRFLILSDLIESLFWIPRVYWLDHAAQWQVVRYAVGASGSTLLFDLVLVVDYMKKEKKSVGKLLLYDLEAV